MATVQEARDQLSHDLGDDLEGRIFIKLTDNGTALTAKSDEFLDFDDDELDTERMTLLARTGSNSATGQERKASLVGDTATVTRAFTNTTVSGDAYEVHRLFTGSEKDNAIIQALKLVWPKFFVKDEHEFVEVANKYEYDISAAGFFKNIPRQLLLVSETDTELATMLFDWAINPDDGFLRIGRFYGAGRTYRAIGHKKPTLTNIATDDELLVITARAAMYLYDQALQSQRVDFVGRFADARDAMASEFLDRMRRFAPTPIPVTKRFSGLRRRGSDRDWSTP